MKHIIYLICILTAMTLACTLTSMPPAVQPTVKNSPAPAKIQGQISTQTPKTCYGLVNAGKLNLRAAPDPEAKPDGAGLVDGDIVRIIGTVGQWYKVETADGREGYAKADYVSRPGCDK